MPRHVTQFLQTSGAKATLHLDTALQSTLETTALSNDSYEPKTPDQSNDWPSFNFWVDGHATLDLGLHFGDARLQKAGSENDEFHINQTR